MTIDEFKEKASKIHNGKYDYSKSIYIGIFKKVTIICPYHGEFEQTPDSHLHGKGCKKCNLVLIEEFKNRSNIIHNNKYDYSFVTYKVLKDRITITCPIHGLFTQLARKHIEGNGCPDCARKQQGISHTTSIAEFTQQASKIHNNYYNYSLVDYVNARTKVEIICPKHGSFTQRPDSHLRGSGCRKCCNTNSKPEILWLNSLNIPTKYRNKIFKLNNTQYRVDALDIETNTIYEFYGDYYHGNPLKFNPCGFNKTCKKLFGELYLKTIQREKELKLLGFNIISIWESDFKTTK